MEYFAKLPVGATLHHGTYEIRGVLGQGGFGVTYLGFDLHLQKEVAIKEFFPQTYCTRTSETNVISLASESSRDLINDLKRQFVKEARNITRQQFIDEAIRYQNNSLTKLDSQRIYDWSTLKTTPTSDGGVTASFVQTYNKTVDVDGNWVTRQYRLTTEVTFNSAGLITKYKERTKLIDEL